MPGGRPPVWAPIRQTVCLHQTGHQYHTRDGAIRDRSRNRLTVRNHNVVVRNDDGTRQAFELAWILAKEYASGEPDEQRCCVCQKVLEWHVEHLDGDRGNLRAGNLIFVCERSEHERKCVQQLMRPERVPWGVPYQPGIHAPECGCRRCGSGLGRHANKAPLISQAGDPGGGDQLRWLDAS